MPHESPRALSALQNSPRAETLEGATIRDITPLGARVGATQTTVEATVGGTMLMSRPRETWGCPLCGALYGPTINDCPIDGEPLMMLSWIHTDADSLVGVIIQGRYELERVLGRGGMGTVYQARHVALGKRFALKILRQEVAVDADSVKRFVMEAQITAAVKHENLADVSDCGEITGADIPTLGEGRLPFFVMEMLRGESLGERLRERGRIDSALATEVFRQCALGLAAAHDAGIIHRDLKPDNIFLSEIEGQLVCKILDFGVAKIANKAKLTKAGTVFGTPHYMSPEQASGGTLDGRTDLYALGVVMYEALSGRVPFSSETHMGVLTKHVFETPEPIETLVDDPASLGALGPIIMRCLEKSPDARFHDALELAKTVEAARQRGFALPMARPQPALRLREPAPPMVASKSAAPQKGLGIWPFVAGGTLLLTAAAGLFLFMHTSPVSSTKPEGWSSLVASRPADENRVPTSATVTSSAVTAAPDSSSAVDASATPPLSSALVGQRAPSPPSSSHATAPMHLPKPVPSGPPHTSGVVDTW